MYTLVYKNNIDGFLLCLGATTNSLKPYLRKKKRIPNFDPSFFLKHILHLHGSSNTIILSKSVNEKLSTKII